MTLSLTCLGQDQSQQLIDRTAEKIGIQNSDIFSRLATSQEVDKGILVVIPAIAEKGEGYMILDSHLILIDDKSGEVKAQFRGEKDLNIDAISIDKIEIKPKPYQLNETTLAYGLKIFLSNQSRPNPYSSTQLSLYALEGDKLNRVLKDYPIVFLGGKRTQPAKGSLKNIRKKCKC